MTTTRSIFGASGDLAARLLCPVLGRLDAAGRLDEVRVPGLALEGWSTKQSRSHVVAAITQDDELHEGVLERLSGAVAFSR